MIYDEILTWCERMNINPPIISASAVGIHIVYKFIRLTEYKP